MAPLDRETDEVTFSYVIAEPGVLSGVPFAHAGTITFAYTTGAKLELLDMFVDLL
jgi:hypothetical protein